MEIKTKRLVLRPICEGDREGVIALLTNEVVGRTYMIPDLTAEAAERTFQRLAALSAEEGRYVRGICLAGRLIGFLNDQEIKEGKIELGWAVHPDHHNRGLATEAVGAAISELFARGYTEVTAGAFEENPASLRVMEKCGMTRMEFVEEIEYRGESHHCIYYHIKKSNR